MDAHAAKTPAAASDERTVRLILSVMRRTGNLSHQPDADPAVYAAEFARAEAEAAKRSAEAETPKGR